MRNYYLLMEGECHGILLNFIHEFKNWMWRGNVGIYSSYIILMNLNLFICVFQWFILLISQ